MSAKITEHDTTFHLLISIVARVVKTVVIRITELSVPSLRAVSESNKLSGITRVVGSIDQ